MIEDSDQEDKVQPESDTKGENNNKPFPEIGILGINLVILIIYTVLCKMGNNLDSLAFEAMFIGLQVFVCVVIAIAKRSGMWLLSGFLILVIGFSTCVGIDGMR